MLAYVFWHAAPDEADTAEYEKTLLRFGDALANASMPGMLGNASYAIGETPWLAEPGYEDWAYVEGSWALDPLNERAVSGAMEQSHGAIARATKHAGLGALYYHVAGEREIPPSDSRVFWLTRPRGISWREVVPTMTKSAGSEVAVWRRQMVLGPATEFALIGPPELTLDVPEGWKATAVNRRKLG